MELSASFTRALLSGFDRAYADLLRVATRSTGSREEAGDLVHDTWLRLAEHARNTSGDQMGGQEVPRDAAAYLAVMAQHMALDAQRRQQRHLRYLDTEAVREQLAPSHAPDVADTVMYRQALTMLEDTLIGLPERSRAAFVAHRVHGERQPDIAARLGVSLNTVERDLIQANACIEDALHRWRGGHAGSDAESAKSTVHRAGRRRSLGALLGVAGIGLGGSLGWRQWRHFLDTHVQWQTTWASARGQQFSQQLPDGSSVLLDALSRAEVRYFAVQRMVALEQGAAFFDVARNPERPFIVQAGGVRVTVLGTRFGVERTAGSGGRERVTVQVESGRVRVDSDVVGGQTYELGAGQGLRLEGADAIRTQAAPRDAAAWRHGELAFAESSLGEVLQRLSRYASFTLEATPEAARLPLSGRVRIAQAQAWVLALPRVLPVQVRSQADGGLLVALAR